MKRILIALVTLVTIQAQATPEMLRCADPLNAGATGIAVFTQNGRLHGQMGNFEGTVTNVQPAGTLDVEKIRSFTIANGLLDSCSVIVDKSNSRMTCYRLGQKHMTCRIRAASASE